MKKLNLILIYYMIYLKRGNDSLRRLAGVDEKAKYASFVDFFDNDGTYKLAKPLEGAYKAATPNQFQKDFIETVQKTRLIIDSFPNAKIVQISSISARTQINRVYGRHKRAAEVLLSSNHDLIFRLGRTISTS